jgi:hypothetical protein
MGQDVLSPPAHSTFSTPIVPESFKRPLEAARAESFASGSRS